MSQGRTARSNAQPNRREKPAHTSPLPCLLLTAYCIPLPSCSLSPLQSSLLALTSTSALTSSLAPVGVSRSTQTGLEGVSIPPLANPERATSQSIETKGQWCFVPPVEPPPLSVKPGFIVLVLLILSLLLEKAMDFQGDSGGRIEGGNYLDPFLPQVDQHASQWGQEVSYPAVYIP